MTLEQNKLAESLAEGFIKDFWSSNHELRWTQLEAEAIYWLDKRTVLVGKRDGLGWTSDGKPFFGDWKTASLNKKRFIKDEKARWRMSPQALTYGLLNTGLANHFTVRWVFKTEPVTTDFEWYEYSEAEIDWWRTQLLNIASEIRELRMKDQINWPLGLEHCTKYGEKYKCPFRDQGCWALNFNYVPDQMQPRTQSHLAIENALLDKHKLDMSDLIVLDATRVGDWIGCHELYRRMWEGQGLREENENLEIGSRFHEIIAAHLDQIKAEQDKAEALMASGTSTSKF
jgi:hypothetical protein